MTDTHIRPAAPGSIRLAADLDTLSRAEIDRLQADNLATTIAAARGTPAVRRRWPGLDGDFRLLPLLHPAEVAAAGPPQSDELLLGGEPAGLVLRTSGTAAKAKVMYHSWQFTSQVEHLGARGVRAALPDPPRRAANCMSAGELNGSFLFVQDVTRLLKTLTFPLGSRTSVADAAAVIAGHGIDTLVSGPAYGAELVTSASAESLRPLRHLLYLGEPMGAERQQAVTAAAPDLTVRSFAYSTSETGPIGYQCARLEGTEHHVHEDAMLVEIVDEQTGEPVNDGTPGQVVVTPLSGTGMALFRYRIGDRGYLNPRPCACGSAARVLTLLGRSDQTLNVDTKTISSDQLMNGLATLGVGDAADCQLQVLWDFPAYRVRLLLSPRTPVGVDAPTVRAALADAYQLNWVLTNPRCTSFTVERVPAAGFARTERDKVPVLYQRLG